MRPGATHCKNRLQHCLSHRHLSLTPGLFPAPPPELPAHTLASALRSFTGVAGVFTSTAMHARARIDAAQLRAGLAGAHCRGMGSAWGRGLPWRRGVQWGRGGPWGRWGASQHPCKQVLAQRVGGSKHVAGAIAKAERKAGGQRGRGQRGRGQRGKGQRGRGQRGGRQRCRSSAVGGRRCAAYTQVVCARREGDGTSKQHISSACGARHQPPTSHYVHTPSQQGQHLGFVTCMASGASAFACSPRATAAIPQYASEKTRKTT